MYRKVTIGSFSIVLFAISMLFLVVNLVTTLHTDAQVESVVTIEDEFRPKLRGVKTDSTLSDAERTARSKALNEEKRIKLETALGKETDQKVEAFYKQQKSLPQPEVGEKKEKVKIKTEN